MIFLGENPTCLIYFSARFYNIVDFQVIQSLRAFRRAEIVFDAVLFGNCVVGAAVAMTVASIFRFEFWFLWCVVLGVFFVSFGGLCGS